MISNKTELRHHPRLLLSFPPRMDRSSSETLSSTSSSSDPNRNIRSAYSKKRRTRANVFPYAPHPVPNVSLSPYLPCFLLTRFLQPWVAASNADPLKCIESRLLPHDPQRSSTPHYSSSTHTFHPPILHAGWPINEDALLQWCTDEGFDRTTYDINDRPVFDYRSTVASALFYLAQRSGLSSIPNTRSGSLTSDHRSNSSDEIEIVPYIQSTCNRKAPIIVALLSNYDIEGVKRLGTIKNKIYAFGRLLLREGLLDVDYDDTSFSDASRAKSRNASVESPKWYLDYKRWQWVPTPKGSSGLISVQGLSKKVAFKAKDSGAVNSSIERSVHPSRRQAEQHPSHPRIPPGNM